MKTFRKTIFYGILFVLVFSMGGKNVFAETISVDASKLLARASVSFSPRSGSFVEGSTFEVPIIIDTRGLDINGIEIHIGFDKNKLAIVQPSGGKSIIGMWVEPPSYDNTKGVVKYVGVIPNGITTNSGLIGTITFKAKATGSAVVSVHSDSNILLNDGLGTQAVLDLGRAEYTIIPKAPEGVQIFSDTHPFQSSWYNNHNPVFSWIKDPGVLGFSFLLDDKPTTIPDNTVISSDTTKSFENLNDGLWYFHIKANKGSTTWGTTGHFLARIDTTPPASFIPQVNYLVSNKNSGDRALVSFFTTDNLSGVDHYEVGTIDKNQPLTESPVFVESESPFQVPLTETSDLRVIVRAIDKAGNTRDASIDVHAPTVVSRFFADYIVYILVGIIVLGFSILMMHYLFGHHILRYIRKVFQMAEQENKRPIGETVVPQTPINPSIPAQTQPIEKPIEYPK